MIVDITTNHGGFFIFKLCHNDDVTRDPGQECFEANILQVLSWICGGVGLLFVRVFSEHSFPEEFNSMFNNS